MDDAGSTPRHELHRGFGLLQATAMNMSNMVGVGPFLTIPMMLAAMGGPLAILGWLLGMLLAVCDGMVWAELAAVVPRSGGTFEYLRAAFAGTRLGRLLPFLFIWQFILSGPLEIASGNIGFAQYFGYLVPLTTWQAQAVAVAVGAVATALLYRKIESIARLMVALWVGVILTMAIVLVSGLPHFDSAKVFTVPSGSWQFSIGFFLGLGSAMSKAMYTFFGYYSVCYVGDEVKTPARTIPRSILISVLTVGVIYLLLHVAILSVIPWRTALHSECIASEFMERLYGRSGACMLTVLMLWTVFASIFTLLLGYSRVPYTAARDGYFFAVFGRLHATADFPHVSLLVMGAVAMAASLFSLEDVIDALVCTRILVQFVAQVAAVTLLRRRGDQTTSYRMALYPLPSAVALVGWLFIFAMSGTFCIVTGFATIALGMLAFAIWARRRPAA